jgi:hypothetical protein
MSSDVFEVHEDEVTNLRDKLAELSEAFRPPPGNYCGDTAWAIRNMDCKRLLSDVDEALCTRLQAVEDLRAKLAADLAAGIVAINELDRALAEAGPR